MNTKKKWLIPLVMWLVFEIVAATLWLTKDNLVYLGLICQENMQIEGFWYYLFIGVFEAATIHYAVAKIFGPLLFSVF